MAAGEQHASLLCEHHFLKINLKLKLRMAVAELIFREYINYGPILVGNVRTDQGLASPSAVMVAINLDRSLIVHGSARVIR